MHHPFPSRSLSLSSFLPLVLAAVCLFQPVRLHAGPPEAPLGKDTPPATLDAPDPIFHHAAFDLQFMGGLMYSLQRTTFERPNFDYAPVVLRLGYMVNNVYGSGFFRGNDEVMIEGIGAPVFVGPGTGLGGLSLLYRRNFLAPNNRLVPYLTAGVGGIYTDAYHVKPQRALGSPGEFDLQGAVGLRFRVSTKITLDTEFSYRHLSNAGLAERNYGTNAIGGMVGLSYGF